MTEPRALPRRSFFIGADSRDGHGRPSSAWLVLASSATPEDFRSDRGNTPFDSESPDSSLASFGVKSKSDGPSRVTALPIHSGTTDRSSGD